MHKKHKTVRQSLKDVFKEAPVTAFTKHGLRSRRPGFDSRQGKDFSVLQTVQTGSAAHPASYPMSTGGCIPGGKSAGA
jgi:hypothetical protein